MSKYFSNVTGTIAYASPSNVSTILSQHMTSKVQWVKQIKAMYDDGARVFVEFGPGKTLTKLVSQIWMIKM